jgi:hypothetical protein
MMWVLLYYIKTANGGLKNKKACLPDPKNPAFPLKNQWTALRAARQNSERFEKSFLMAELRRLRSNPVRDPY